MKSAKHKKPVAKAPRAVRKARSIAVESPLEEGWIRSINDEVPAWVKAELGDFAVCFFPVDGDPWRFQIVKSRDAARVVIQKLIKSEEILRVVLSKGPRSGQKSPVIWVTYYDGENWPDARMGTDGADEYLPH